jgi:hypothetical protein
MRPTELRQPNPKPKAEQRLIFPSHLTAFLTRVSEAVEAGSEETTIESDDLLQESFIYGGLNDEGGDVFGFTFFPEEGNLRYKWEFWLTKDELRAVRDGSLGGLTMWCCVAGRCRSAFRDRDDTCLHCDWEDGED